MANMPLSEAFDVLKDRDSYLEKIANQQYPKNIIVGQIILMCLGAFFYGLIMGSYNSLPQALITGVKIWILFFMTLLICFPSFLL